jgi:hypothetical protein
VEGAFRPVFAKKRELRFLEDTEDLRGGRVEPNPVKFGSVLALVFDLE